MLKRKRLAYLKGQFLLRNNSLYNNNCKELVIEYNTCHLRLFNCKRYVY
jgi:hypothetical protein